MKYNDKKFKVIGAVHTPIFYIKFSKQSLILFVLLGAILFIGIGYSAINSVTAEITGGITATTQNGVFITDVTYVSGVDANVDASNIEYYRGTMLQSLISLSEQNPNSEIKYKVTIYNNSEETYPFVAVLYDEEFYDNPDIVFEISGFNIGETIGAKETKELYITFKYKNQTIPEKTILSSYINFKIAEPNRLMAVTGSGSTAKYLRGTVIKNQIEEIEIPQGTQPPEGTINELSFDASEKQDKSIMGYYTDTDGNGLYKLTFLSPEIIATTKHIYENYLFSALVNLKTIKFDNFSTWGTTRMHGLFNWCSKLETLDLSKFDTSKVTGMGEMFSFCSSLTTLDVSILNTSNVTNMNGMFNGCSQLTTLDLSNFNTSNVTNMNSMFSKCNSLATLDVSKFNTENVKEMRGMFDGCSGLTTLDLSNFDTSKVTAMDAMFRGCSGLTTLDLSNFNVVAVRNASLMFYQCGNITTLNLSNFSTNNVENMYLMFGGCRNLTTIYVSEFNAETNTGWTTTAVTNSKIMFSDCTKLVGGNGTTYNNNITDKTYAVIDTATTPGYLTNINKNKKINRLISASSVAPNGKYLNSTIIKNKIETIEFKLGKEKPEGTIEAFDASEKQDESIMAYYTDTDGDGLCELTFTSDGVIATNTEAQYLFQNLTQLTKITFDNFSTNGATNMQSMFSNCSKLITLDVSKFNTSNVTSMLEMFYSCRALTTLNLSNFNTSSVTNMQTMFSGCMALTTLDLSGFNTINVITMRTMFNNCKALTTIYVSEFNAETSTGWTTTAVTNSTSMFSNCTNIIGGNGTTYNNNIINKTYAVIDTAETPGYLTNINHRWRKN